MLALLCLLPVLAAGCREDTPIAGPDGGIQLHLVMNVGDEYRFDRWLLDQYGYVITSSKTVERWRVYQKGATVFGDTGLTLLDDSVTGIGSGTVYMKVTEAGALYQFGFLDRVVRQMGIGKAPPQWDQLLPGTLQSGEVWVVGVADSAARDTVYGSFNSVPEYFSAVINGVQSVVSAYRIDLTGQRVQYTFWVTDTPTCITAFQEESNEFGPGFEAFLTWARVAAPPP